MKEQDLKSQLGLKKVLIPVIIGLAVSAYMLYTNLTEVSFQVVDVGDYVWIDGNHNNIIDHSDKGDFAKTAEGHGKFDRIAYTDVLSRIDWSFMMVVWLFVALIMMFFRDFMYIVRLRILTEKKLNWRSAFNVVMLWEFASAITPSVIGGSGPAIYFLHREKIKVGKATAIVMVSSMLDELFYVVMVPVIILLVGWDSLFPADLSDKFSMGMGTIFILGYSFILLLILVLAFAIFINPLLTRKLIIKLFNWKLLRRWKDGAVGAGNDLALTSREMIVKPFSFWLKVFGITFIGWTARFWVVNFLILAFTPVSDHLIIYGRQLVMWVIMLISPTPGSSGVAEVAFSGFLKEFIPLMFAGSVAILWRLYSYYPYLFIGTIILPRWLRKTAGD